ncbi:MAG: DDE-type integrase/transposase/recombinase [Firmicutes bacterium]|nr:DDE-type integrase/transposase/recombinase [Bacillota bacterium]MCR4947412.1 DDE-type integrase/transposase/recombinase [Lachnospiraceae bacterium]
MNETSNLSTAAEVAQFRFALIAPVIQGLFPDASRTAYYKRVTENPLTLPDGTKKVINYKTLEKWVSVYQRGGIDALMPATRSDKGTTRALTDLAIEEVFRLKQAFPRLNATQIHKQLIQEGFIPATVSVCAVQRFIRHNDLKSARNPSMQDRKAFEEDAFGKMWQTDTCYFPHITEDGRTRRVYAICIIDDHSRLIVGAELFYSDTAANFQSVFKKAVATYTIPAKLYTDNGAPYVNEQLALICGSIGTVLLHTKVRDGASKAKIERFWRTCKETWLYGLDMEQIHSLKEFNVLFQEFIRSYNTSMHSGIGCTPFERYQASTTYAHPAKSSEWLDECFLNRITRKVRKDATVSIDKVSFDVPAQFIGQTVDIRFRPGEMDSAVILFEGVSFPVRMTDKNENCRTKRNNPVGIDYTKIGGCHV